MIENILPEDTLETGFRTKANNAFDEIINNDPFIEDGVVKFPKHGGSEWTMDLSSLYYTKDQVLDQLSPYDQYATESLSGRVMRATFDMLAIGTDTTRYVSTAGTKWMIENTATLVDDYTIGIHNFEFGNVYLKADGNTNVGVNVYDGADAIIASINSEDTGWELLSEQNEYKANLDFSNLVADVNIDLSNLAATTLSGSWNLGGNSLGEVKDLGSTTNYNWNLIHNNNTIATITANGIGIGVLDPSYKLDVIGTGHFSGAVTFDTVPSSLQDATTSNHLVRYSQWIASTSVKYLPTAVKTVSLTNITLSGTQTVNGVALIAGDRILVAGQTSGANNGVYIVDASTWTRATDSDTDVELRGFIVSISNGTYTGYKYINTNTSTITVGTTAITYAEFSNNIEIDPVFTSWRDQERTANTIWAAPIGVNGVASWRALSVALGSQVTGVLPIANGGTGSSTQNFVDLTTTQTVGGLKTFSGALTAQSLTASSGAVTAGNFSTYGITYNTLASSIIQSGQQLYFAFKPLVFRASQYAFDRGNVVIGGNTSGLPADFDFGTERLQVNGNIRYNTLLKPNNVSGTNGQVLATNGTQDAWKTLTVSDISDISTAYQAKLNGTGFVKASGTSITYDNTTYQPSLPSGTAGQFLIRNASNALEWSTLELEPTRLTRNKIGVGDSAGYLSSYDNLEFTDGRFISILRDGDSTKSLILGMYGVSNNSFLIGSGGNLTIKGDNGLIFSNFTGGGTMALTVDNFGQVGVTPLGTGSGTTATLSSTYIGYGSSGNALTGTSNFTFLDNRYVHFGYSGADFNIGTNSTNGFVESVNGSLLLQARGSYGVIVDVGFFQVDALGGGGTKMVVVDNDGKFATQTIPSGGGVPALTATQIGYGSGSSLLTSSANFVYDATKTAVYLNQSSNYLYVGKSETLSDMWEIVGVGTRGIQLNTEVDIVVKNSRHLYLGSGGDNQRVHIGRGANHDSTTHYLVINGENFSFSMSNISGWGDSNSASTPQVGDKILFNVVDVGGQKRFVPQKINKKQFEDCTGSETVLIL
jgi:hypothetical protein